MTKCNLLIGFILFCAFVINAQVETNLADLNLEDLMKVGVSTASKILETTKEAPSSITVFTREQIDNMGITNVYDLLNFVPGFQATRDIALSENEVIHVRGIGGLKPYVLVQIDGERINDIFIERGTQFLPFLSTANVKQVEVIGGPTSALYGSDAVLGTVNVITEKEQGVAQIRVGSQSSLNSEFSVYSKYKNGFDLSLSAFHLRDEGFEYQVENQSTKDPKKSNGMNLEARYRGFRFNTFYYDNEYENFIKFSNQVANGINRNKTSNWYFLFAWEMEMKNNISIKIGTRYVKRSWSPFGLVAPASPSSGFSNPFYFGVSVQTGDLQNTIDLNYRINSKNRLSLGFFHRYAGTNSILTQSNYLSPEQYVIPADSFYLGEVNEIMNRIPENKFIRFINIYGLYGQYKRTLIKSLKFHAGLRYDRHEIGGNAFNPRVGLIYNTPIKSTIKVLYGAAFRSPSFNELFSNDPVTIGNLTLKPEKSYTCEVAYYQEFKRTQTIVTYFRNTISNIIRETTPVSGPSTFLNTDSLIISNGLEFSFNASISDKFLVGATFTTMFEGKEDSYPYFGSFILNYRVKKWNFNINSIYRPKIELLDKQEPYMLFNGKIRYKVGGNVEVNATVLNIFDEHYFTFSERLNKGERSHPK